MNTNVTFEHALDRAHAGAATYRRVVEQALVDLESLRDAGAQSARTIQVTELISDLRRCLRRDDTGLHLLRELRARERENLELRERVRWLTISLDRAMYRSGIPRYLRLLQPVALRAEDVINYHQNEPCLDPERWERELGGRIDGLAAAINELKSRLASEVFDGSTVPR